MKRQTNNKGNTIKAINEEEKSSYGRRIRRGSRGRRSVSREGTVEGESGDKYNQGENKKRRAGEGNSRSSKSGI